MHKAILGALILTFKDFCEYFAGLGLSASEKQEIQDCLIQGILQKDKDFRKHISTEELNALVNEKSLAEHRDYYVTRYSLCGDDPSARNALSVVMDYESRMLKEFIMASSQIPHPLRRGI